MEFQVADAPSPTASVSSAAFTNMSRANTALKNLPSFNGMRDYLTVSTWLIKVEAAMALLEKEYRVVYDDASKIFSASLEFTDDASVWWYSLNQGNKAPTTWEEFKSRVKAEFIPED